MAVTEFFLLCSQAHHHLVPKGLFTTLSFLLISESTDLHYPQQQIHIRKAKVLNDLPLTPGIRNYLDYFPLNLLDSCLPNSHLIKNNLVNSSNSSVKAGTKNTSLAGHEYELFLK